MKVNKIIFDEWERKTIIEFYEQYPIGSWRHKPFIVAVYERMKAVRNFKREFINGLKKLK
jgi:hypothetical protein